jgi:hypothetical protein
MQMADNVFDHHHRAVDNHAEVQSPQRKQIRGDVPQVQADGSKKQRKGYRQRHDDCASDIAQEDEKDNHH